MRTVNDENRISLDMRHRASVARLREICRAREVLLDFLNGANQYRSTEADLRRYFDAFAVAAANERVRSSSLHRCRTAAPARAFAGGHI
jgi:hypothetical protein